jgi:hypothetical protein
VKQSCYSWQQISIVVLVGVLSLQLRTLRQPQQQQQQQQDGHQRHLLFHH